MNKMVGYEDFSKFGKGNLDACVDASVAVAKGIDQIGRTWLRFAEASLQSGAQAAKAMMGAKDFKEALVVQSDLAKSSIEKLVAESTKVSQMTMQVANAAMKPFANVAGVTGA